MQSLESRRRDDDDDEDEHEHAADDSFSSLFVCPEAAENRVWLTGVILGGTGGGGAFMSWENGCKRARLTSPFKVKKTPTIANKENIHSHI